MANPRVFTIPASVPFLPTLIRELAEGRVVPGFCATHDPLSLASATLYLPTRRACRMAREAFLEAIGKDVAIMPHIVAIGDVDEDEIIFAEMATGALANTALELPEALEGFERRISLAELVLKWANSRSEEHTSELQSHRDLHSFPTRRSSDLGDRGAGQYRARIARGARGVRTQDFAGRAGAQMGEL